MLFQKYYFESTPDSKGKPVESWYMILRSVEDVLDYCKIDSEKYIHAFLALPKALEMSHPGGREGVIHTILDIKAHGTPEGERFQPLLEVADFIDKKAEGMLKTFLKCGTLRVNEVGGYSSLAGYIETWQCKLVQEIEKDGLGFPKDDNTTFETDLIILENDATAIYFNTKMRKLLNLEDKDLSYVINHLKERDSSYIIEMCTKTKNIAISSNLVDLKQLDKMMKLFLILPNKNVYLELNRQEALIKEHELYPKLEKTHTIHFI